MDQHTISLYERIILESLATEEKTFKQLSEELGLKEHIIQNGLSNLVIKNYIKLANKKYFCKLNSFEFQKYINNPENTKVEINFLQKKALEQTLVQNKPFLKLRKVYLTSSEKTVLKSMLANLESFLNSTSKKGELKNQNLVYWCNIPMQEIVNSL